MTSLIRPLWKIENGYFNENDSSLMSDTECEFFEEQLLEWKKNNIHPGERRRFFESQRVDKTIHSLNLRHDTSLFLESYIDWREVRDACEVKRLLDSFSLVRRRDYGGKSTFCCPWHEDRIPSFSFNHEKKVFYCFSCLEHGSIFDFVMKQNDCTFSVAVKYIYAL